MKVGFIEKGSGPALILLHGMAADAEGWRLQLEAFSATHRVIALDLPGYGRSARLSQMKFTALARWLHDFLSERRLEQPILVGHSFGGMIVQEYVATFPGRARAMILYATSPAFGPKDGKWQRAFIRSRLQPLDDGKSMEEMAPDMIRGLVGSGARSEGIERAREAAAAVPEDTFRAAVHCLADFDRRDALGRIGVPCLVLAGSEDTNAPPEMMARMATRIPTAQFVSLPGLGHLAHLEDPESFNDALQRFLGAL